MLQLILNFMERVLLWLLGLVGSRAVCAKATQMAASNCKKARAAARTVHRSGPPSISEEREFLHGIFAGCHRRVKPGWTVIPRRGGRIGTVCWIGCVPEADTCLRGGS